MVPAIFISVQITGNPIPQLAFGSNLVGQDISLLAKLDEIVTMLGFNAFTAGSKSTTDLLFITAALMVGTAGLPHVIVRFFTVPDLPPKKRTMTRMRFPIKLQRRKSQNEEKTIYRRTNNQSY